MDLGEVFGGTHDIYLYYAGINGGWAMGNFEFLGMEFDPRPDIHNDFDGVLQVLAPLDDREYYIGDIIDISGRTGPMADPDTDITVVINDKDGNEVYRNDGDVSDNFGYIDRIPTDDMDPGEYTIVLTVTDGNGDDFVKEIPIKLKKEITLSAELEGVELVEGGIAFSGSIDCNEDSSYELQILTYNDEEESEWTVFATGDGNKSNEVLGVLPAEGLATGTYTIRLTVTSESGVTCEKTTEIDYVAPDKEYTDEELFADLNDDFDGKEVTFITDIEGIAKGTELDYYTVEVISVDTEEVVYTFTDTEAVEGGIDDEGKVVYGKVGELDPTLLMNGYYRIVLTAYAAEGKVSDEVIVLVTGQAKIGNFTMTFNDMTLPIAGLPVDIYRTYDSRQRNTLGDFGYGWTMSIGGPSISVSGSLGEGWSYNRKTSIIATYYWVPDYPHEIYIDWGNGSTDKFELKLNPQDWFDAPIGNASAYFENKKGNGNTLTILDSYEGLSYDPVEKTILDENFALYAPKDFMLENTDGMKYYFTLEKGLYKVEDQYGRTITIGDNGIVYSDGETSPKTVLFDRDEEGKIKSISYDGSKVEYNYDERSNLVKVIDIGGYKSSFEYDDNHYVTNIYDNGNSGKPVAKNEYDDDGRLVSTTDAYDNVIYFDHTFGEDYGVEKKTDRLGHVTVYKYDDRGNVRSITNVTKNGNITTSYTYDDNNNKLSETKPDGTTFNYTYNNDGNLIEADYGNGKTVSNTYDVDTGVLTKVVVMGTKEFEFEYDNNGNPTKVVDALDNTQHLTYDNKGNLTSVTDSITSAVTDRTCKVMTIVYEDGLIKSTTNADGLVVNYSYINGRLASKSTIVNGVEKTDRFSYDKANRIIRIDYADGNYVTYTYNQADDVVDATDCLGRTTHYDYDLFGNITQITYPDNTTEKYEHNAEGWIVSATDRLGRMVKYNYDELGNVIEKVYPNGKVEKYEYDVCGRLTKSKNIYGAETKYEYDSYGRNTRIVDPYGCSISYEYTDRGNVKSVTDAKNNKYDFTYDNAGNQTSVTYPNGSLYLSGYDKRGRLISETDAEGHTTNYEYDVMDRLVSVTNASGKEWKYSYDQLGNLVSVSAPGNASISQTTKYKYDSNGRVIEVTNANGNKSKTGYFNNGLLKSTTDFGGKETAYTYDTLGRLFTITVDGEETRYTYDLYGNISKVEDPSGTVSYTYNGDGFLSSVTNANGETISYSYNNGYQLSKITIDNQDISYDYDTQGRLISVTDSDGTTSYTYDDNGNLESTTYPNGVVTNYEYNSINALVKQVTRDGNGILLTSYEYTIGANGERLSVKELGRTVDYEYDELNRLVKETVTRGVNVSVTEYEYDANSNRTKMIRDGVVTTYTYNELNQLTKAGDINYIWDNAGNLVSLSTDTGVLVASYTYDSHNRMISANVSNSNGNVVETYTYDYLGNRTSKTSNGVTTTYTTDLSSGYSQILKAETGSKTVYYTRGFELISRREGSTVSYYIYDGGLSVRGLTDETGAVTDTLIFDAFGNETKRTGTTENPYGFQGEEQDATGFYYLRARYMDPSTGTFTSMDTYSGSLSDPMSLHKYMFANANPVMNCDPSGHFTLAEMDASMVINNMLDSAYISGFVYILDAHYTDPELEHHDIFGYFGAMLGGFLAAGLAMVLASSLAGLFVLALLSAYTGGMGIAKGVSDFNDGNKMWGTLEIIASIAVVFLGAKGFFDGLDARGFFGTSSPSDPSIGNGTSNSSSGSKWGSPDKSELAGNTNSRNGELAAERVKNGETPCIGKMKDINADNAILEGDKQFPVADYLPNRGNAADNWSQNSTVIRRVIREAGDNGIAIRDLSQYPMKNAGFLGAERNELLNRGWTYQAGWWYPPTT